MPPPTRVVVVLNRDLRVHDHPALSAAAEQYDEQVVLFVVDDRLVGSGAVGPNRARFLCQALADLRGALRGRGGELHVRRGDRVNEAMKVADEVGASALYVTRDVGALAQEREAALGKAAAGEGRRFETFPGVTVVDPDALRASGGGHYRVFTPFWRAWRDHPRRSPLPVPRRLKAPGGLACGRLPAPAELTDGAASPELPEGGETAGRAAMDRWLESGMESYDEGHDDLAGDRTSRLSPYLHFGCVSPVELESRAGIGPGAEAFVRQLAWRDFHHQVTLAFPEIGHRDYRSRGRRWRHDHDALDAWRLGQTGYPIVDAGMRQLRTEGWMHNRARLITASFLTKTMGLDWRHGARHFMHWLVDAEVANNYGNWQWVAGTGNDTRPNRVLNPIRQAERFDPDGAYVRRHVPELAGIEGRAVHQPWKLGALERSALDYTERIVDHETAAVRP